MEYSNKYFTEYLRELKRVEISYILSDEGKFATLSYNGFTNTNKFAAFLTGIQQNLRLEVQNNLFGLPKQERIDYLKRINFQIVQLSKWLNAIADLFGTWDMNGNVLDGEELSDLEFYYTHSEHSIFSYMNIDINMPAREVILLTTIADLFQFHRVQWDFYEMFGASDLIDVMEHEGISLLELNGKEATELIPEFEYDSEAQKIAWLYELGVLETILSRCKTGETNNWSRSAKIIHSFTGIHAETIRKSLMALYEPNNGNAKNNPTSNPANRIFVSEMLSKFKLNKVEQTK